MRVCACVRACVCVCVCYLDEACDQRMECLHVLCTGYKRHQTFYCPQSRRTHTLHSIHTHTHAHTHTQMDMHAHRSISVYVFY